MEQGFEEDTLFPDGIWPDLPERLGMVLKELLSEGRISELAVAGSLLKEEMDDLCIGPVLKQVKQEKGMRNEDLLKEDLLKEVKNTSAYREMFLTRKLTGARRQTYLHESLYKVCAKVLPVIASEMSIPTFLNNVLAEHLERYRDVINELCDENFKEVMKWRG